MAVRIITVVGARPNLMKIAPIMEAFERVVRFEPVLVHTGQHYDTNMNDLFFRQLDIPKPEINLGVGSGSHGKQTGAIMQAFEPFVQDYSPDAVLVVGDVNGTMACALVAAKLGIPLIHVEAGLRSFDRSMPEEINRVITDSISDILFCTEESGVTNLKNEGIDDNRVHFVGNVMIDALLKNITYARNSPMVADLGLKNKEFVLVTLHRPSNVDDESTLQGILDIIAHAASNIPLVFPVHPRTLNSLNRFGLLDRLSAIERVHLLDPLGYIDFLSLTSKARVVITDSGGIQEETTVLGVPCLTLRFNTERPVTITSGTNRLVGNDPVVVNAAFDEVMEMKQHDMDPPPLWDGHAADRIVDILGATL